MAITSNAGDAGTRTDWRRLGAAGQGVAAGLAVAVLVLIWITVLLFTGPGATASVLLPVLLLLLPLLGIGALCGFLVALAIRAVARRG